MSPDELKARARRFPEEVLTQGDLAVAAELVAPDCVHHTPVPVAPGPAGLIGWVAALRRAFPDLCALVEDEVAEGDTLVQRLTLSGTHAGEFLGLPPAGVRATWQAVAIQRLGPDGKFAEHRVVADHLGLLWQLGTIPAARRPRGPP